jgi:hypothetical protein
MRNDLSYRRHGKKDLSRKFDKDPKEVLARESEKPTTSQLVIEWIIDNIPFMKYILSDQDRNYTINHSLD